MSFAFAYPCAVIGIWMPALLLLLLLLMHAEEEKRGVAKSVLRSRSRRPSTPC